MTYLVIHLQPEMIYLVVHLQPEINYLIVHLQPEMTFRAIDILQLVVGRRLTPALKKIYIFKWWRDFLMVPCKNPCPLGCFWHLPSDIFDIFAKNWNLKSKPLKLKLQQFTIVQTEILYGSKFNPIWHVFIIRYS